MSVLVDKNTRVICQGITGAQGHVSLRAGHRLRHPHGRRRDAGQRWHQASRLARLRHCRRGRARRPAPTPRDLRSAAFAGDAILEAIDAGVALVVCITEGIPVLDMVKVKRA